MLRNPSRRASTLAAFPAVALIIDVSEKAEVRSGLFVHLNATRDNDDDNPEIGQLTD
jgi:cell division FtsZ-interacting protein ZapD